jgi:hypothetical protein
VSTTRRKSHVMDCNKQIFNLPMLICCAIFPPSAKKRIVMSTSRKKSLRNLSRTMTWQSPRHLIQLVNFMGPQSSGREGKTICMKLLHINSRFSSNLTLSRGKKSVFFPLSSPLSRSIPRTIATRQTSTAPKKMFQLVFGAVKRSLAVAGQLIILEN